MHISFFKDHDAYVSVGKYLFPVPTEIDLDSPFAQKMRKRLNDFYVLGRDAEGYKFYLFRDQDFYKLGKQLAKQ